MLRDILIKSTGNLGTLAFSPVAPVPLWAGTLPGGGGAVKSSSAPGVLQELEELPVVPPLGQGPFLLPRRCICL